MNCSVASQICMLHMGMSSVAGYLRYTKLKPFIHSNVAVTMLQDDIKLSRKLLRKARNAKKDPQRLERLRKRFLEQCKKYFGVPYAKKYWSKESEFL